jgi:hypothetical protein
MAEAQVVALTGDILRQKTLDRLVEMSNPVDGEGNTVALTIDDEDDTDVAEADVVEAEVVQAEVVAEDDEE